MTPDAEHLLDLVNDTIATTGRVPELFSADAGYHSSKTIAHANAVGSDALTPPDKLRRSEWRAQ